MENKINLILDLDETLIHTVKSNDKPLENNKKYINLPNFFGIVHFRKYLQEFLNYCYTNFTVSFWTASNSLYCKEILKIILNEEQFKNTKAIFISEENNIIDLKTNKIYKNINSKFKPLDLLWEDKELSESFNRNNTLLIDNDPNIVKYNLDNSIQIDSFLNNDSNNVFCKLSLVLENIKNLINVRSFKKEFYDYDNSCKLLIE
tara:strand:+ start:114 stop:725 length:612 start_codon:yes stop_codon:yes gene_type:complete